MRSDELLLIDLSSIAHALWHISGNEPDPDVVSRRTVERVRALSSEHPHAAVCCDSGRSFRADIDPAYKANRPAPIAPLHHQIALAREQLVLDGYPVWAVKGFEADDLIATATARALAIPGASVLIASSDKDLLQLVNHRVRRKTLTGDGEVMDADAVKVKYGVGPEQMCDYLALCGDASDNIKGAERIGAKTAAALLSLFGSLDALYVAIDRGEAALKPAVSASLAEFRNRKDTVRSLIALRADVDIPFEEIAAERVARTAPAVAGFGFGQEDSDMEEPTAAVDQMPPAEAPGAVTSGNGVAAPREAPVPEANGNGKALVPQRVQTPDVLAAAPPEWGKQLEPRSLREAQGLASAMFEAKLFNGYGNPPAVLSTIMAGRELGLQAVASLRAFHIVEGRHMLHADLIRALVLKSGLVNYFRNTRRTATAATFEAQRGDDPQIVLTYTIEEGRTAFGFTDDMSEKDLAAREVAWSKSGWGRNPADMCVARAGAKLARLVAPEVVFGLYAPEEFDR